MKWKHFHAVHNTWEPEAKLNKLVAKRSENIVKQWDSHKLPQASKAIMPGHMTSSYRARLLCGQSSVSLSSLDCMQLQSTGSWPDYSPMHDAES